MLLIVGVTEGDAPADRLAVAVTLTVAVAMPVLVPVEVPVLVSELAHEPLDDAVTDDVGLASGVVDDDAKLVGIVTHASAPAKLKVPAGQVPLQCGEVKNGVVPNRPGPHKMQTLTRNAPMGHADG